jgi:predicted lipoprotein with Yx(FWY)xxD motif
MHTTRTPGRARLAGWVVAGVAAAMLLAAACSGGGSSPGGYGAAPAPATTAGNAMGAVVDLRTTSLGKTLVDGQGRTLYLFEADTAGRSNCQGPCTSAWPPYLSNGAPQAGTGVAAKLLGTIPGEGGGAQVTYHGHPLYHYAGDARPGDTTGQGLDQFGAKWYVVAPSGDKIDGD